MRFPWKQLFATMNFYRNVLLSYRKFELPKRNAQLLNFEWYLSGPLAISTVYLKTPVRFTSKQIFTSIIFYRNILHSTEIRITETYSTVPELE